MDQKLSNLRMKLASIRMSGNVLSFPVTYLKERFGGDLVVGELSEIFSMKSSVDWKKFLVKYLKNVNQNYSYNTFKTETRDNIQYVDIDLSQWTLEADLIRAIHDLIDFPENISLSNDLSIVRTLLSEGLREDYRIIKIADHVFVLTSTELLTTHVLAKD